MFLTCQACDVQYRLDPSMLGVGGRMVRCTACGNIWFQLPENNEEINIIDPATATASVPDENSGEDLLEQIGIGGDTSPKETAAESFSDILEKTESIPDVVKPVTQGFSIPVMEYRPMGMGAMQFGIFSFLLFTFITMIFLFSVRVPMVNTFPVMTSIYKVMGFTVRAPGEGLRLTEMTAENHVQGGQKKLAVQAKLTNISEADIHHPALLITLKGQYGRILKDWHFAPEQKETLKSGNSVPVKLEFKDADPAGKTVEMKVVKE